jgi:hypothetical protein|nr:MAG TPA: hypothetical protein [Caudoviricetes sp.]DAP82184.1 MAG TPA: hypothetical protein [Caudoviricetes sp.]
MDCKEIMEIADNMDVEATAEKFLRRWKRQRKMNA